MSHYNESDQQAGRKAMMDDESAPEQQKQFPWQQPKNSFATAVPPLMQSPEIQAEQYPWTSKPTFIPTNPPPGTIIEIKHPANWPSFYPLVYHDIQNDIAPSKQPIASRSYTLWGMTCLMYSLNVVSTILLMLSGKEGYSSVTGILLSVIYLAVCPALALVSWHMPLYRVMKNDRALSYWGYFISFGIQLAFAVFLGLGFFFGGGGGLIGAIDMLKSNHIVSGIFALGCTALWALFFAIGIYQLKQVAHLYRHGGHTLDKARNEMLQSVASNPHSLDAIFARPPSSNA